MVWFKKIFLGASPQTPNLLRYSYGTNVLNIVLLEESLKTKTYSCRGIYIYEDVPSEEALPPALKTRRRPSLGGKKYSINYAPTSIGVKEAFFKNRVLSPPANNLAEGELSCEFLIWGHWPFIPHTALSILGLLYA